MNSHEHSMNRNDDDNDDNDDNDDDDNVQSVSIKQSYIYTIGAIQASWLYVRYI